MILLDTHIWVWWVQNDERLKGSVIDYLDGMEPAEIGISAISCWEVATLHTLGRLSFSTTLEDWMEKALRSTGVVVQELSPEIAIESANLPGNFHRDPADRYSPEAQFKLDAVFESVDGPASWRYVESDITGLLDFMPYFSTTENVVSHASCRVIAPREIEARISLGRDWQLYLSIHDPDREFRYESP